MRNSGRGKGIWNERVFEEIKRKFDNTYAAYCQSDESNLFKVEKPNTKLGIGIDALEFARHGAHVTAVDLSPKNIELAKKYFSHNDLIGTFLVGNAEELCFPDNSFDLVVAIGVFIYTPDIRKALDEVLRVVKPGGEVICMFWNRISWYTMLVRLSGTHFDHQEKDAPMINLYSVKELKKLFERFSAVETRADRFPTKTIKRSGGLARLYNYGLVPFFRMIPKSIMKPFGFHIIVKAVR